MEELYSEKLHIKVSVDAIYFKPISLKELLKLEQLNLLDSITCKAMMGEFLLYYNNI